MARQSHSLSRTGFPPDLVARILDDTLASPGRPPIVGLTGVQGSGKSTLAAQLANAGKARGLTVIVLSIDDFYLTRRQRQALGRRVHPLLATRGPPGTHDIALAGATLDALRQFQPGDRLSLPRFDKLGDRRLPPSRWRRVQQRPDLVVFEGWFLKVPPEPDELLDEPLNALERNEDADGRWRRHCNAALADYAALWQRLDRLLWLRGPGFEIVPRWRWQQERTLQAAHPGRNAMSRAQVERFVLFFERVSRQAERTLAGIADRIVDVDENRNARLRRR